MATLTLQPNATAGKDIPLLYNQSDINCGVSTGLFVGFAVNNRRNTLIQFNVSSIPSGSTVSSASLGLYETGTGGGNGTVSARRMLVDWVEGTGNYSIGLTGETTWSHRIRATVAWNAAGATGDGVDRVAASSGAYNPDATVNQWAYLSNSGMVADVQAWVDGTGNYGWHLSGTSTENNSYHSSDYTTDTSLRPKFTVEYTVGRISYPFPPVWLG
jgi:hypothetical protein